jgi:hypothetical protein
VLFHRRRAVRLFLIVLLALGACSDDPEPCSGVIVDSLCRVVRITGADPQGELGFRFGEPRDLDGDGVEDLLAGARRAGEHDTGEARAWSRTGALLGQWTGSTPDSLFGHSVISLPDLDGDGSADVVIAAPNAVIDGEGRGFVDAYTLDGRLLWHAVGRLHDGFGWQLAPAGDRDGDGIEDIWSSAPADPAGSHVYLVSGSTGDILDTIASRRTDDSFGFYLAVVDDLDHDGVVDLAIGAPAATVDGVRRGSVTLISGSSRRVIGELDGERARAGFGRMIAPLDDIDGDGVGEIVVGAPDDDSDETPGRGEIQVFSGATAVRLRRLEASEEGELYGRMIARLDDLDGDGLRELAIAAPWWHGRYGRVEVRSARTFELLADLRGHEGGWLGWHITRAAGGLVASSLHWDSDRGALDVYRLP